MKHNVVTVFGGAGFIGLYVVRALAQQGVQVRVACRRPEEAMRCKPMGDVGQIVPVAANIRNEDSVAAAVRGAKAVINLVGVLYNRGQQNFDSLHVDGARTIAEAAQKADAKRLIHISAIGADLESDSEYARSKALGEQAVEEAFPGTTILRPSIVFGPEDDFFNRFAALARLSPALPVIGPNTKFQPVYVGDVADAVSACLADDATAGCCYELGGPTVHTFQNLMEIMLAEIGRKRLLVPAPFWAASAKAYFLERLRIPFFLPKPLLTRDQVRLLKRDNVVGEKSLGVEDLGITPTSLSAVLPTYLCRYRRAKDNGRKVQTA
ncbi:MAG: complex I NDUFA9 subunit family protein [Rhodospirillaceae bacterium]|nr:complex I NDUFA9 subunit family protein [Rhodospirillaceae bacterium]|tara:strand:+ start:221 stop:1189 length:969 start_codon:yes stop_codon:yes gene_type:complete